MNKIGIYYGSNTGNTKQIAEKIAQALGVDKSNLYDVAKANSDYSTYDVILFGSSTFGYGDLQDDWDDYLSKVKKADLNGKKVALFGCGDSVSYSDTFGDALGEIYKAIKGKGCQLIGKTDTTDYSFDDSEAVIDNQFIGLLVDEDNEYDKTDERINTWIESLKKEF